MSFWEGVRFLLVFAGITVGFTAVILIFMGVIEWVYTRNRKGMR